MSSNVAGQPPEMVGRYRIIRPLGQGGMGSVYLAHDTELDRQVALKMPHLATDDGSKVLERFYREARAAATLRHPNICPVFDIGDFQGVPFLTMAYIEGKPLSEFVRAKPLTQGQAATLVRKLALALHEAHQRGVIHRDLKPANVMLDRRGEPIVMDFGLARRSNAGDARITQSGTIMGTPAYMPPEQIGGALDAMGPACDVYSLGVILFELLTGRLPFQGDPMAMLAQILTDAPPRPSQVKPDVDPALEAICLKAMAKKPEERYASMADFAKDLQEHLRSKLAKPEAPPTPRPKAAETQAAGLQLSNLGGLRSLTQAARDLEDRPGRREPSLRFRKKGKSHQSPWLFATVGIVAAVLLLLTVYVTWSLVGIRPEGEPLASTSSPPAVGDKPHGLENPAKVKPSDAGQGHPQDAPPREPPATPARPDPEDGWTTLFNGIDLAGWREVGAAGGWRVERGELVMEAGSPARPSETDNWLMTNRDYRDFILQLEFWLGKNGNSGVGIRSDPSSDTQLEVAIYDEEAATAPLPGHARTGGLHGLLIDNPQPAMRKQTWHAMTVEVRGRRVMAGVDGVTTVDASLDDLVGKLVGNGQLASASRPGIVRQTGPIGLQKYTGTVRFRKIRVKDLGNEAVGQPSPSGDKNYLAALQGEWTVVAEEFKGRLVSDAEIKRQSKKLRFDDKVMTIVRRGETQDWTLSGDVNVGQGTIDFTGKDYFDKPRTFRGIFELNGDTLRLAYPNVEAGLVRPAAFRSAADNDVLVIVARRSATQAATPPAVDRQRPIVRPREPTILQHRTLSWNQAKTNFARYQDRHFDVGMGSEAPGWGHGTSGVELENVRRLKLSATFAGRFKHMDANSFAGFMIDYRTAGVYSRRVALHNGIFDRKRQATWPPWGKGRPPDEYVAIGSQNYHDLDLGKWAPADWDGRAWFTVIANNTGAGTRIEARITGME